MSHVSRKNHLSPLLDHWLPDRLEPSHLYLNLSRDANAPLRSLVGLIALLLPHPDDGGIGLWMELETVVNLTDSKDLISTAAR